MDISTTFICNMRLSAAYPHCCLSSGRIGRIIHDLHLSVRRSTGGAGQWFVHGAIAAIYSILAEGLFEHDLGDSEILTMFLTIVACAYVVKWERLSAAESNISGVNVNVLTLQCPVPQ